MLHFTADDGARIAFRDSGDGPPLICLAGLTRTMADFDYLAPHLRDVRMIRMDYRGRGASDRTGAESYTIAREAADVVHLMDHLRLGAAPILGTSRGGLIGMALAAIAPRRIAGLCLNDIGPVIERAGLERIATQVGRPPAARTVEEAALQIARGSAGFARVPAERWRQEARHFFRFGDGAARLRYDPALRTAFLAALNADAGDAWPLFDALAGKPVALIRGTNSDILSVETAEAMARRRPDMILAEIPDRGHVPFLDEPESLAAIRAFLGAVA